MIEYRLLETADLPRLVPLAREFTTAIDNPIITLEDATFVTNWTKFLELKVGFIIAAYDGPTPVGALSAYIVPNDLNGSQVAQETWWFVKPEYRGSGIGENLIELFERYARSQGARRVSMGVLLHLKPVADLLTKRGYVPFEKVFYRWLE